MWGISPSRSSLMTNLIDWNSHSPNTYNRSWVRGTYVTSLRFRPDNQIDYFNDGERRSFVWTSVDDTHIDIEFFCPETFKGDLARIPYTSSGDKFVMFLDDGVLTYVRR